MKLGLLLLATLPIAAYAQDSIAVTSNDSILIHSLQVLPMYNLSTTKLKDSTTGLFQ
jgi:hypothetical protein